MMRLARAPAPCAARPCPRITGLPCGRSWTAAKRAVSHLTSRCRRGDRSVRPHFQTVRVRAVVSTAAPLGKLAAVIEETEARCPVLNLLLDAKIDLRIEWLRDTGGTREAVPRLPATT
jgi:hypothetical protein